MRVTIGAALAGAMAVAACGSDGPTEPEEPVLHGLVSGNGFSCALDQTGAAWCWGSNQLGQLGRGTATASEPIGPVTGGLHFEMLAAGDRNACGLADGRAYCWGAGSILVETAPLLVPTEVPPGQPALVSIAVGGYHGCGLNGGGRAFCWGGDSSLGAGALGNGTGRPDPALTPVLGGLTFQELSAGFVHSCGRSGGAVWCWGSNFQKALGLEGTTAVTQPTQVSLDFTADGIRAGAAMTCAESGELAHCWGSNLTGQLGRLPVGGSHSASGRVNASLPLGTLAVGPVNRIASHACGLGPEGQAVCWGANDLGQLGRETVDTCAVGTLALGCGPLPAPVTSELRFQEVAVGADHTCAIADGAIWCWGGNARGQLGNPSTAATSVPTRVVVDH